MGSIATIAVIALAFAIPSALAWTIGFLIFRRSRWGRLAVSIGLSVALPFLWPALILAWAIHLPMILATNLPFEWVLAHDRKASA